MPRTRSLVPVAFVAAVVRALYWAHPGWFNPAGYQPNPDERWYNALAVSISQGLGFDPQATYYTQSLARWPGYPYALGALYRVFGASPIVAHAYNATLGVATCVIVAAIAGRLAGTRAAVCAGIAAALFPPLVYHVLPIMTEAQFTFLYAAALWFAVRYLGAPSGARAALVGAAIGCAALTRAAGILLLPCVACVAIAALRPRSATIRHAAVAVLVAAAVIAPWGVRNWNVWHRVAPLGTGGAYLLYSGNSTYGEHRFLLHDPVPEAPYFRLMASKPDAWFLREAYAYAAADPARFARLTWAKFRVLWKLAPPWRSAGWSVPALAVYLGPPLLGAAGLLLGLRRPGLARHAAALSLLLIAAYSALFTLTIPEMRYRVTVVDPLLLVWAGVALGSGLTPLTAGRDPRTLPARQGPGASRPRNQETNPMNRRLFLAAAACVACLAAPIAALAADAPPDMGMMMKASPETEMLQKSVGVWNAVQKMWMDPSKPPVQGAGRMVCESINKGLWVGSSYTGDMMGMPFEGHDMLGWDPIKKKFVGAWSDNVGMGLYTYEGTASEDGKTITFTMTGADDKGQTGQTAMVLTVIDNDHHKASFWRGMDTTQPPMMTIEYTRDTDTPAPKAMKEGVKKGSSK